MFDAQAATISLYLGVNRNQDAQAYTAKVGSGDFIVGKGFDSGTRQYYGRIAEVRVWAGAMASANQVAETAGD